MCVVMYMSAHGCMLIGGSKWYAKWIRHSDKGKKYANVLNKGV